MSAPDITDKLIDRFRTSSSRKHLSILLGAGASIPSYLPDWDELARRLLLRSRIVPSVEYASKLVDLEDPFLATEAARQAIGQKEWDHAVQKSLYDAAVKLTPTSLHYAASEYALGGDHADTTLMTLNFDTLLEQALAINPARSKGMKVIARTDGKGSTDAYSVYHLHGIVTRRKSLNVVLTLSDFNMLLTNAQAWQSSLIEKCVRDGDLLIAGTSYRDPDIRCWLHAPLQKHKHGHHAYVLLAREAFLLSHNQFNEISPAFEAEWEAAGLTPILVEDHTDAAQILRELRLIDAPDYLAPQRRSEHVWRVHDKKFGELQDRYYGYLQEDFERLTTAFKTTSLNVSLWLADGQHHIARWASQDRRYRSTNDLHLVGSGHDSPWVAGQALSTERPLFKDLGSDWESWFHRHVAPAELPVAQRFESSLIHRWKSVIAIPIRVQYRHWPVFATAVLSIGLPEKAEFYQRTTNDWSSLVTTLATNWSDRLSEIIK